MSSESTIQPLRRKQKSSKNLHLPPRPPSPSSNQNPLKRKLNLEENYVGGSDSGVKVIVRIRPPNKNEEEEEIIVQKVSNDSLSILGQTFWFDSVADINSSQQEIFQLVGAPLVENCLAGFNSTIFAYGQTGSGKTYTMWGPTNALLEGNFANSPQGLTPRVFEQLFTRINEEKVKHADRQLQYKCRCSFLEIYNEEITDLLNPTQKNLLIRKDVKSGVYVENLTEELVCTIEDVTQILMKGFSNRKTGATKLNAESLRSHSVFTCVVETQCKSVSDGLNSIRTSRINLVDLAGSERQKSTGAEGACLKEAVNINCSLSKLGKLINILAEVSQSGKQRHIPYRDSRLTFLLQESLGGNAKLAMICAISPAQSCKSETLVTLRFAQRAKEIKNKAVVNEVTQDDVNVLREMIRQLNAEKEKEKRYLMDVIKGLQAQLRDTGEAVQAAGELLVRLKEAEEVAEVAQERALVAEQEAEKAYKQVHTLKKNHEDEILILNQLLAESRQPKEPAFESSTDNDPHGVKYDITEHLSAGDDEKGVEELEQFNGTEPSSWFSGDDMCNI